MFIKKCISYTYFSTNIKKEIMQPLLSKIFVPHMVKVLFQNALLECLKWFIRIWEGNFNLSYKSRLCRPSNCKEEAKRGLWSKNARQSTLELEKAPTIPKSTVYYNLKKMGMINRYDVWIPHVLTEKIDWKKIISGNYLNNSIKKYYTIYYVM